MKEEIKLARVRKRNDLITKSRFSLSLQEQKIVLFLISKIKPTDTDFQEYTFSIKDFCEACMLESTGGEQYEQVKEAIKNIADQSLWVKMDDGRETLLRWIEKASIEAGMIQIRLDNDLKPYLLQLQRNYTTYELIFTLGFKSKYTIRLYELIQSLHFYEDESYSHTFKLTELIKLLGAESYKTYSSFRERVLDPAIKEINAVSDKSVSYEVAEKDGKKITALKLTIFKNDMLKHYRNKKKLTDGTKARSKKNTGKGEKKNGTS